MRYEKKNYEPTDVKEADGILRFVLYGLYGFKKRWYFV